MGIGRPHYRRNRVWFQCRFGMLDVRSPLPRAGEGLGVRAWATPPTARNTKQLALWNKGDRRIYWVRYMNWRVMPVFCGGDREQATVKHMEHLPSRRDSCGSRRERNLAETSLLRQYMRLSPFSGNRDR